MSLLMRGILILFSFLSTAYAVRKIRKAQMKIEYAMYWFLLSALIVILGCFPNIAIWVAALFGIESPINLVFLVILFLVLVKLFSVSVKQSQLENKIAILTEEIAVRENLYNKENEAEQKKG